MPRDAQVIITLGRVAAEKKIDGILRVMPDLLTEFPKLVFVIAGDGPDVDVLKEQVERLTLEDHVIFTGNIPHDQVASYYKMADFFVSASDTETQGLTYIEALGSGRKCVVYKTDYTDQVFNDPAYGLTFESLRQMKEEIAAYLAAGPAGDSAPAPGKKVGRNFRQPLCQRGLQVLPVRD